MHTGFHRKRLLYKSNIYIIFDVIKIVEFFSNALQCIFRQFTVKLRNSFACLCKGTVKTTDLISNVEHTMEISSKIY